MSYVRRKTIDWLIKRASEAQVGDLVREIIDGEIALEGKAEMCYVWRKGGGRKGEARGIEEWRARKVNVCYLLQKRA